LPSQTQFFCAIAGSASLIRAGDASRHGGSSRRFRFAERSGSFHQQFLPIFSTAMRAARQAPGAIFREPEGENHQKSLARPFTSQSP
jgi:hypothetical protein